MFTWFKDNFMQANPNKFQMITFGPGGTSVALRGKDKEIIIESQIVVNVIGIHIDVLLKFDYHMSCTCMWSRASSEVDALDRI